MNTAPPRIVALLPMKHTSERVPGKNYRDFHGLPLFKHVLRTLQSCVSISEIVIDTDSEVISSLATGEKKVRVVRRPEHLLGGHVPMNAIIEHDIKLVEADYYFQTHSTNPLLRSSTISTFISRFLAAQDQHDTAFTVTERKQRFWTHLARAVNHDPAVLLNTQDLQGLMEENSCGYLFSAETFLRKHNRIGDRPMLFSIDPIESVDIDTEQDFLIAQAIYSIVSREAVK